MMQDKRCYFIARKRIRFSLDCQAGVVTWDWTVSLPGDATDEEIVVCLAGYSGQLTPVVMGVAGVDDLVDVQLSRDENEHLVITGLGERMMKTELDEVLARLNRYHQRATYTAVGRVIGKAAQWVTNHLTPCQETSWVVREDKGEPSGFFADETHPHLLDNESVISNPDVLRAWLATHP